MTVIKRIMRVNGIARLSRGTEMTEIIGETKMTRVMRKQR